LAFKGRPQLLEKLGIKMRKARTAFRIPKPAAPTESAPTVEASTVVPTSDQPAAYQGNGHVATISS
jgi:hypothetical protein